MDATSIAAGYQGAKYALESLSALVKMKLDAETMGRVVEAITRVTEVQASLLGAQQALMDSNAEIGALKATIAQHDAWEQRAAVYELWTSPGENMVMRFKGTPIHYACPNCFEAKKVSVLQDKHLHSGDWECKPCNVSYKVDRARPYETITYKSDFY